MRCTNRPSRRSRRRRRPKQTIKRRSSSVGIKTASCSAKQTSERLCKHWTCEDTAKVNQHDEASLDRSQTGKSAPVLQLNAHFDIDKLCVAHFSWLRFSKEQQTVLCSTRRSFESVLYVHTHTHTGIGV